MHTELKLWRESGLPMREAKGPDRNWDSEDDLSQGVILHVIRDGLARNTVAEQWPTREILTRPLR